MMSGNIRMTAVAMLAIAAMLVSCGSVTETGNPCSTGDCVTGEPVGAQGGLYTNAAYGVSVAYPSGWSVQEVSSDVADFVDARAPATQVRMTFARPLPVPDSLQAYLTEAYPGRTFTAYQAGSNDGYLYDDPAAGGSGGDVREHFFLGGNVLVQAVAEVFTAGEADLADLLAGISFSG